MRWTPSDRVHHHLPASVYKATFADTLVLSPNLNVAARGTITVDGQRYELDGDPLGQTHLWGRKHAYSWAWSHCNAFDGDRGAALETLSVRLRRGPVVLPKLTMLSLYLDGDDPSELQFRDFWKLPLARSDYGTGRYHLHAADAQTKLEVELTCRARRHDDGRVRRSRRRSRLLPQHRVRRRARHHLAALAVRRPLPASIGRSRRRRARTSSGRRAPAIRWCASATSPSADHSEQHLVVLQQPLVTQVPVPLHSSGPPVQHSPPRLHDVPDGA